MDTVAKVSFFLLLSRLFSLSLLIIYEECLSHNCSSNATCVDKIGHFECYCNYGFEGNGYSCQECLNNNCGGNSTCIDQINGYECECNAGFVSDGSSCSGIEYFDSKF